MSEPDVSRLMTVAEAIAVIDAVAVSPRVVEMALAEADGLRLAEEIRADRDYPPFDKALMDGYAVRAGDRLDLRVVGEVAAGAQAARGLAQGEAIAIMTGAPLPQGADTVVPIEETGSDGSRVRLSTAAVKGRNIAPRASEVRAGEVVLERGVKIGAAQIAAAASVGAGKVRVFARPRAAVLATGDELVNVEQTLRPSQIRNSNSPMLLALLRQMGCEAIDLGIVRDDPALIRDAIERGLAHDALFISGGMSMGAHDHVPRILRELGVELLITKLKIKPGKPFVFGVKSDEATKRRSDEGKKKYVFGLPGNPVSGFVCTVRFASRLLRRIGGANVEEKWRSGRLTEALPPNGPREFYLPVALHDEAVQLLAWKGSADVFTLAKANALLVRKENEPALQAGMMVRVLEV